MSSPFPVLLYSFLAHAGGTTSASFSPDGQTLAAGGYDCAIRLWDVATWQETVVLPGHRRGHVAFSPDGSALLTGGLHADATLYDAVTWQVVQTLEDSGGVWALAFRPDGNEAVLVKPDDRGEKRSHRPIEFRDTRDWKMTGTADVGNDDVYSMSFSPDGETVALAHSPDGLVSIWSRDFGQRLAQFHAHRQATWGVAFSPGDAALATVGADNRIRLWDASWQMRHEWPHQHTLDGADSGHGVLCVTFSPDGELLVTGSLDGMLLVWKLNGR